MYITVKLLNGFSKPLTYKIPDSLRTNDLRNRIVQVPLRTQQVYGLVIQQAATIGRVPYAIRELTDIPAFVIDEQYMPFIDAIARYYGITSLQLLARLQTLVQEEQVTTQPLSQEELSPTVTRLTDEQQAAVTAIAATIDSKQFSPHLLYGITGSGKTEVYKQLIIQTIAQQKSCLLMLPEVSLAGRFEQLLKKELPADIQLFSFHSATKKSAKQAVWQALLQQRPVVIVGVHLPILLPIANLGLIIVDEEHEPGYQEKKYPRLNSKEVAIVRAMQYKIPIVLGSATPAVATLYNVYNRNWPMHRLTKRFNGKLPTVTVVSLTHHKERPQFWITNQLQQAIAQRLERNEQSIIFLNRRGYSKFVQCLSCGSIPMCMHCSVSLTVHDNNRLICHYCNFWKPLPSHCAHCSATTLLQKGIGTQQLVKILAAMFPKARIARADLDTTSNKKWQATVEQIYAREIDIIVGTQTITKGYDFPGVTLVGIIWADCNVHFPIYTAHETALQQLLQVAGRAGRATTTSDVIVQSMRHHAIFEYLDEEQYLSFYNEEIAIRTLLHYPPTIRMAEIELQYHDEGIVHHESLRLAQLLRKNAAVTILGPSVPAIAQLHDQFRRKIYCKAATMELIAKAVAAAIKQQPFSSLITWTPNPLH